MATVRVRTKAGVRTFEGESIARSATGNDPRWIEFELYRLDDGGGYAVVRGGMSRQYHGADSECSNRNGMPSGTEMKVSEMARIMREYGITAEPSSCDVCKPPWPEDLDPDEKVRYEAPRVTLDIFKSPAAVIMGLTTGRSPGGFHIPKPVEDLLAQAAAADSAFISAELPEIEVGVSQAAGRSRQRSAHRAAPPEGAQ